MKLEEGKLVLTEEELDLVKKANMMASPSIAGIYLRTYVKNRNLTEGTEEVPDAKFYIECIQAYRNKNYEII